MAPKSCKNESPPHICVLDEGHKGPHQAYRTNRLVGFPVLMAEWHGGGVVPPEAAHEYLTPRRLVDRAKLAAEYPKPIEDDMTVEQRIMDACRIAAGQSMSKDDYLIRNGMMKPPGIDSPIAMQMALEAEKAELLKKINEGYEKMPKLPPESDAYEGKVGYYGESKSYEGLAAWLPSAPGTFFGINRTESRCTMPDCNAAITFESYIIENTLALHEKYGVTGSSLRVCKDCRAKHGVVPVRQPAITGVTQHKACFGVRYSVFDRDHDEVLIVAENRENPGWGRMVRIDGMLMRVWSRKTNAPRGEVALTDDDLETILNQFDLEPMHFQPWMPASGVDEEEMEERDGLQRELFFSDPVIREHVGRAVDINPGLFMNEERAAAFQKGLDRAWDLAWGGPTRTVESIALARACDRCDTIMNIRRGE